MEQEAAMRLIDAGLALDNLRRLESMKDYDAVKAVINNMPTAYNLDKVVKQLEDRSTLARPVGWTKQYEIVTLKDAIEIVKGSGLDKC